MPYFQPEVGGFDTGDFHGGLAEENLAVDAETQGPVGHVSHHDKDNDMKLTTYLHKLVKALLTKVKELKTAHPSRPIILAGWGAAAAINCQAAQMDLDTHGNMMAHGSGGSGPPPPPGAAPGWANNSPLNGVFYLMARHTRLFWLHAL